MSTATAVTAAAQVTAGFSNTCESYNQKWRPKAASEFLLGTLSLRNPTASTVRSRTVAGTAYRGNRRFPISVVPRATAPPSAPETGKDDKDYQNQENKGDQMSDDQDDDSIGNAKQQQSQPSVSMITLDDVNPVGLGRRSRQIFDELWRKFSGLGQISRTTRTDDETSLLINEGGPMCEFAIPGAQNTTVLVVGGTSRVGRILVRKLMLRGYTVKALVRKADQEVVDMLPTSVEIVIGDVGDPSSLKAAVKGCNKIIYCATARSSITGDLNRVDHQGVSNLTKAFQVGRWLSNVLRRYRIPQTVASQAKL